MVEIGLLYTSINFRSKNKLIKTIEYTHWKKNNLNKRGKKPKSRRLESQLRIKWRRWLFVRIVHVMLEYGDRDRHLCKS